MPNFFFLQTVVLGVCVDACFTGRQGASCVKKVIQTQKTPFSRPQKKHDPNVNLSAEPRYLLNLLFRSSGDFLSNAVVYPIDYWGISENVSK